MKLCVDAGAAALLETLHRAGTGPMWWAAACGMDCWGVSPMIGTYAPAQRRSRSWSCLGRNAASLPVCSMAR